MKYEFFIGLRYLRARRQETFISLITVISVLGVMIGVMTLNVVMAVMSGFEETLRDRLLGINAHISVVKSGEIVVRLSHQRRIPSWPRYTVEPGISGTSSRLMIGHPVDRRW